MAGKESPELFEAYYSATSRVKKAGFLRRCKKCAEIIFERFSRTHREIPKPSQVEKPTQSAPAASGGGAMRLAVGRPPMVIVSLSANAIALVTAVAVVFLLAFFSIGYVVGEKGAVAVERPVEKNSEGRIASERAILGTVEKMKLEEIKRPDFKTAAGSEAAAPADLALYRIQVVTLPSSYKSSSEKLIAFLKGKGIEVTSRSVSGGRYIVIYAGGFADKDSAECQDLLSRVRKMEYDGKTRFKDAYIVKVQ